MASFKYHIHHKLGKLFKETANKIYYGQYLKFVDSIKEESLKFENKKSRQIWTMWLQEDIPEICKACIDSIKSFYPDTIVITEKNMNKYVEIPNYIMEKYKKGKMKACHLSDYIRVFLLDKYGGLWIDSTCFLTQKVPEYIFKSNFFILKKFNNMGVSNFFIYSDTNSFFIKLLKKFLEEYWKKEDKEIEYFFFHRFISTAIKYNKTAKEYWDKIPINLNINTKLMYKVLFNDFNEDIYNWLKTTSYVHKLTYKKIEKNDISPNSLYRYLISSHNKKTPVNI